MTTELRCTAPHPKVAHWECRALLATTADNSMAASAVKDDAELEAAIQRHEDSREVGLVVQCTRCKTRYIIAEAT